MRLAINQGRQQLTWLAKQLKHPDRRLQEQAQNLDRLDIRLRRAMSSKIALQSAELSQMQRTLSANSPKQQLERNQIRLNAGRGRLDQSLRSVLASRRMSLQTLSRSLNSVSPLNTLARGYSITVDSASKVIRSIDDVTIGATITSRLNEGEIVSTVSAVTKDSSKKSS